MADNDMSDPNPRRRTRTGCHTCKARKVKCQDLIGSTKSCTNCVRLGFQCRWQAPVAGEDYVPPPKRRRTIGQRRRVDASIEIIDSAASIETGDDNGDDNGDVNDESSTANAMSLPVAPLIATTNSTGALDEGSLPSESQFNTFVGDLDGFMFDVDFGLTYDSIDLNLAGEGLDILPLPTIDTSLLQSNVTTDLTASDYLGSWPALQPNLEVTTDTNPAASIASVALNSRGKATDTAESDATSINTHNRHLIQHYLDVMTGYAKVDDNTKQSNNLFISAFTKSLHFPPLFHAILAFSSSHLALGDTSYQDQATDLSRLAGESFEKFRELPDFEADGLLSALFVRCKTINMLAGGVDSFLKLIDAAVDIVRIKWDCEGGTSENNTISPLTKRVLIRLAILDGRASLHRLGGGKLVNLLQTMPAFSALVTPHLPPMIETDDYALLSLLRAGILRMKVADLDIKLYNQQHGEFITQPAIRTDEVEALYRDIQYEIDQWASIMEDKIERPEVEKTLIEDQILSPTTYGYYVVLSALHSALLYQYTVYPIPSFDVRLSVSKVMQCQLKITRDPSRAASPSSMLPSSIFMAGLTTSDPVYIHWILQLFKDAEKWGTSIQRGRELLEAMLKQPTGTDVRDIMDEVTGRFIL